MGKFAVKATKTGFVFNLKAGNGEVIATSESYKSKDTCLNGIESVRKCCEGGIEDQTVEGFEKLTIPSLKYMPTRPASSVSASRRETAR